MYVKFASFAVCQDYLRAKVQAVSTQSVQQSLCEPASTVSRGS